MTYLQWIAIFWGIPILSFVILDGKIFVEYRNIFFKMLVGILIMGFISELIALNLGLWSLPKGLSGIYLFTIPVEEYLWTGLYVFIPIFMTLYFLKHKKI